MPRPPAPASAKRRSLLVPLLITLITAVLYLWRLGEAPIYLAPDEIVVAVNAHAIATTGRDVYSGRLLPLFMQYDLPYVTRQGKRGTRTGWLPPAISYAITLAVKVLPYSEGTVRLPTALLGIIDVLLIYFIGRRLFKNEALAVLCAALLALTPSHFIHSRFAMDYLYPLPFLLGWLWCLLIDFDDDRPWVLFAGTLCLGFGVYSYIAGALVMPIYLLLTALALWWRRRPLRPYVFAGAGFALPLLLAVPWLLAHPTMIADIFRKYDLHDGSKTTALDSVRVFFSYHRLGDQLSLYWAFFNPRFLFFDGPLELMFSTREVGVFLLPVGAALLVGVGTILRGPVAPLPLILLLGFLTAPLAATLVNIDDAIYRALEMLPFAVLLAVTGLQRLWSAPLAAPRRGLLTGLGVSAVMVGSVYAARVAMAQGRLPGAAAPLIVLGLVLLLLRLVADRLRSGQLVVLLLLVFVPVQFASFYHDYFTDYRRRTALVFSGNIRGALEEVIRLDGEAPVPAVYLGEIGSYGFGPLYWKFYQFKHHREDLAARTIEAYQFSRTEVLKLPRRSLIVTNAGDGATDAAIEALVQAGQITRTPITEPDGTASYLLLERVGGS